MLACFNTGSRLNWALMGLTSRCVCVSMHVCVYACVCVCVCVYVRARAHTS